jgi:tetratricopeptide (TPR) repeat protein
VEYVPGSSHFLQILSEAEASSASGDWGRAARQWEHVVTANPVEGRFWAHLAEARAHLSAYRDAATAYEQAFTLRDGYPAETAYQLARCYAQLDDLVAAHDWLTRALDLGLRDLSQIRTDDALACLREDDELRERIGLIETAGMSRKEGWQGDLRFLVREVKRRAYAPLQGVAGAEFDAALDALARAIPTLSDMQVIVELSRLLCRLGDGHVEVSLPQGHPNLRGLLPVQFSLFAEGLFIVAAERSHEDLLGAQVLQIGDHAIEEVIAAFDPLLPRDNENAQWPKHVLPRRLRELPLLHALGIARSQTALALSVQDLSGTVRTVTMPAVPDLPPGRAQQFPNAPEGWVRFPATLSAALPHYLRNTRAPYWFAYLPEERIVSLQINAVQDHPAESLAEFSARVFGFIDDHVVDKLVIDLRWNGGGNTFLLLPLLRRIIGSPLNSRGRLFVIIGRGTFSAAQNFTSMLQKYTDAIFVGEPTGSSPTFVGETIPFELPYSKMTVNVSDLLWQGTWPMDYRTWIAPTLYAPPTFAAFRENRDPAFEAILGCDEYLPGS